MRKISMLLAFVVAGCQSEGPMPKGKSLGQASPVISDSQPTTPEPSPTPSNFQIEAPKPLPAGQGPKFEPLPGWTSEKPSSSMRLAQYTLPKGEGDPEDASLIVFYFGGTGGGVDANFDRWMSLFEQPDGKATKDVAKISKSTIQNTEVHFLDVTGTFAGETAPGSGEKLNKPGFAARYAILLSTPGPFFVRLLGPQKTVEKYSKDFDAFLDQSLRPSASTSAPSYEPASTPTK